MTIARFDPFHELETLQDRVSRLFGDNDPRRDHPVTAPGDWVPPVDIYETEHHDVVLRAELPDMIREDIEVTVENSTLTLHGTRKLPADIKKDQYRRIERSYGTFSRSFTLPTSVDASKVAAEYKNGVLTVKLPYREDARPRTINVEVAA